jgi:hypothetical protein
MDDSNLPSSLSASILYFAKKGIDKSLEKRESTSED